MHGDILSAIGKGNLLLSGRMKQFRMLIEQYRDGSKGISCKKTLLTDLQGFWDMVYLQVQIFSLI